MKKYLIGFLCGVLICGFALAAYADQPIAIIVNGQTVQSEVAPMVVDSRIMVPTRVIAEALGADVQWDAANNAVVITTTGQAATPVVTPPVVEETNNTSTGTTRQDPIQAGQTFLCPDGVKVKVTGCVKGAAAWSILKEANQFNDPPESGMQYVLVQLEVENVSYTRYDGTEELWADASNFALYGSSNVEFNTFDKSVVKPDSGPYAELSQTIMHGGKTAGVASYYIPATENNLVIGYKRVLEKTYFDVEQ